MVEERGNWSENVLVVMDMLFTGRISEESEVDFETYAEVELDWEAYKNDCEVQCPEDCSDYDT